MRTVEKLARLLASLYIVNDQDTLICAHLTREGYIDAYWPEFQGDAKAVLNLLLEPSEGMVRMGTAAISHDGQVPVGDPGDPDYADDCRRMFTAMIRHALEEGEG